MKAYDAFGGIMKSMLFTLLAFLALTGEVFAERNPAYESARRAFESGNYYRALDFFSQVINTGDSNLRNRSYYYSGLAFFELGNFYASLTCFRTLLQSQDANNKEMYEKAIKNAVTIADRLNMVEKVGKLLSTYPQSLLPGSVSAITQYALGVHYAQSGDVDRAIAALKSVNPESVYYPKAMFHLGVLATRKKNYKESTYFFSKVLELARGRKDMFSISEIARLNLARTHYSAGDMERSIENYSQFLSSSPHWLTVLLEASWPLMRVNDTTVSLGNLHTIISPKYREDLVGEAYILRTTILYSLCKYSEMKYTLTQFFALYDPVLRAMQQESSLLGSAEAFYRAYTSGKGLNRSYIGFAKRDVGILNQTKVMEFLMAERRSLSRIGRNELVRRMIASIDDTEKSLAFDIGNSLMKMHRRKLNELVEQREQANYLKVEVVTGEKELIEGQKGLPGKRSSDVETQIGSNYNFWPYDGEYWEDELGTYVYTTESSCVN